jgi:ribonuclease T1
VSRRGPGGGRGSRGLRIAGMLVAALAAVLVILAEQGGVDWGPSRAGGTPALPGASPTAPDVAPGTDLAELFPAAGELREVRETLARIAAGGPFPYRKDGTVFRNRERRLPNRPSGYYREYTVETPGEDDRGARRIVQGRDGDTWYTRDHYGSFVRIDPEAVRRAP